MVDAVDARETADAGAAVTVGAIVAIVDGDIVAIVGETERLSS